MADDPRSQLLVPANDLQDAWWEDGRADFDRFKSGVRRVRP